MKKAMNAERLAAIPAGMQQFIDSGDLSGMVTLVWHRGAVARVDVLGLRNLADELPMERNTLFRIASMTKPITSVAAMMLVEEGRLKLDDPIKRWLPEFANMRVLTTPNGSVEATVPAARDITVDDLLTHRGGLAYAFTSMGPIAKVMEEKLPAGLAPDPWLAALGSIPLSFQPGARFHYSHSTDVLGFLVARIAGTNLRDHLRTRIFEPLGMHDTDFWVAPEKRNRAAIVYRTDAQSGQLAPVPFPEHT